MVLQSFEERLSTGVPGLKLKSLRMKEADDQAAQLTPPRTPYGTCAPFCLVFTEPSFSGCLRPVPVPSPRGLLRSQPFHSARTQGSHSSRGAASARAPRAPQPATGCPRMKARAGKGALSRRDAEE